jgi:3-dehydroquinate dehydratase / shikimate dehydrogenase
MPPSSRILPRLCVALGLPTVAELGQVAEREYKDGTTFFEFRLDHLGDPVSGLDLIKKFRRIHPDVQILATCRHRYAHGRFSGATEKQIAILRGSAEAGASLIDLEIESAENAKRAIPALRELVPLIISYHNFQNTPALDAVLRRLSKIPADIYKIATTARKPTDNLRLIQFIRRNENVSLVMLTMSEIGTVSRILMPSLGSVFTYAAPSDGAGTAPGQIPARTLRSLYRSEKLTKQSRVYGVIADPVSHSKSPFIHNRAFQARRLDAVYLPFLVNPGDLGDWMDFAVKLPVSGFSVTIPHKRKIMRYLDVVEPLARRIGAVNTVWRKAGKWRGTNTDTEGVLKPLSGLLRLANSSVLIAGYGGAARAAAVALHDARAGVTITGRNAAKAQALARVVKGEALSLRQAQTRQFDVMIHSTPVGMTPNVDECLFPDHIPGRIVLDMVYSPHETLLLKRAKAQGCEVIPGAEMLLEQAVSQFEIWTGESAPREVMRSALEQHL